MEYDSGFKMNYQSKVKLFNGDGPITFRDATDLEEEMILRLNIKTINPYAQIDNEEHYQNITRGQLLLLSTFKDRHKCLGLTEKELEFIFSLLTKQTILPTESWQLFYYKELQLASGFEYREKELITDIYLAMDTTSFHLFQLFINWSIIVNFQEPIKTVLQKYRLGNRSFTV